MQGRCGYYKKPKFGAILSLVLAILSIVIWYKIWYGGFHADVYLDNGKVIKSAWVKISHDKNLCFDVNDTTYHRDEVKLKNYNW